MAPLLSLFDKSLEVPRRAVCRVVLKPSQRFPTALVVMVPDLQGVGSHWIVLDRTAEVAVFLDANLLVGIQYESVGIILDGYTRIRRTKWSIMFLLGMDMSGWIEGDPQIFCH